jgi:ankyrin repeat protein
MNNEGFRISSLVYASYNGDKNIEIMKLLLNNTNIDVNSCDHNGMSSLLNSCSYGYINVVKLLLSNSNININQCDRNKMNPLQLSSMGGYVDIVKLLLDCRSIDVHHKDQFGDTAIEIARRRQRPGSYIYLSILSKRD